MKRLLVIIFCVFGLYSQQAFAQLYQNEWINYAKTYYKFKIGADGMYRIPATTLFSLGMSQTVSGSDFVLFRSGQEVPIFVSTDGTFGAGDFIEFYGESSRGELDALLYSDPQWLPNEGISMFTDTAAYFLTLDPGGSHLRFQEESNQIPVSPPASETSVGVAVRRNFVSNQARGKHMSGSDQELIFLSTFTNGEGLVDSMYRGVYDRSYILSTPQVVPAAGGQLKISVLRNTIEHDPMKLEMRVNGTLVADSQVAPEVTEKFSIPISPGILSSNNTVHLHAAIPMQKWWDDYGVSYIEIQYSRDLDLSGVSSLYFTIPPSPTDKYLVFTNVHHQGQQPRLYDVTENKWYAGDISQGNTAQFFLPPSGSTRVFVLYFLGGSEPTILHSGEEIRFTDYSKSVNQGDFLIITHPFYNLETNGHRYVDDYADYRRSFAGGSRTVQVVNVEELYDQFAFGYNMHPSGIRNFLRYAYGQWEVAPRDVFFIGKGLYYAENREYLRHLSSFPYKGTIPPYGYPGSDVDYVNFLPGQRQAMNVGRLSAWDPEEIGVYLEKVRNYEEALSPPPVPTYQSELWKKIALHTAGGTDAGSQKYWIQTLNAGGHILSQPYYGGTVTLVAKNTTTPVDQKSNHLVDSMISKGLAFIVYHGHSSPTGFQFNLNNPENYPNSPRFPHFIGLGCDVAQIFTLSPLRTISERYLMIPNGGSITMMASNNLQFDWFHRKYLPYFYESVSSAHYGGSVGAHCRYVYDTIQKEFPAENYFMHIESMLLQGDPAIRTFGTEKPDFHVSADHLSSHPANITTSLDSFSLTIVSYNLGKALSDTVHVKVEHINPAGEVSQIRTYPIYDLFTTDTTTVYLQISKTDDLGLNKYRVTIDYDGRFTENSETNNSATLELFIFSDNLVPVYPPRYGIVHQTPVTLKASTLNPFRAPGRYLLEIDTTALFNSSLKKQTSIFSQGGVIKWTPSLIYQDSVVYYWRAAFDSVVDGSIQWTGSSFIYLKQGSPGWNQSHYFQYRNNSLQSLTYGTDRIFRFPVEENIVTASNAVYDVSPGWLWNDAGYVKVMLNGVDIQRLGCLPWQGTIQVTVFDSVTNAPWENDSLVGKSGSYSPCLGLSRNYFTFEFPVNTPQGRADAAHFIDSIPHGNFVLIRNIINLGAYDTAFVDEWKSDPGMNLYQEFLDLGFTLIDSFNQVRPFIFFRKKGNNQYPVYQRMGTEMADTLQQTFILPSKKTSGMMNSPVIGPAKEWNELKWEYSSLEQTATDYSLVRVFGQGAAAEVLLYEGVARDTSLQFIDAKTYPRLRLEWYTEDTIRLSPGQLDYWRVLYTPVPELALNPAAHFEFTDSLQKGQGGYFSVAIENLTDLPMDSVLVHYRITDQNRTSHALEEKRYRVLAGFDTLHATLEFNPSAYPGENMFFIEANPNLDQPEQYHPNNLGYVPFHVMSDHRNPLIDVTFDGVHILDGDLVSSKPFIKIMLRDENRYLALDDTSLLDLRLRYLSGAHAAKKIPFDGTICKFIPAHISDGENVATIEFRPNLTEDGRYELMVNGTDKSGNPAGETDYRISFEIVNRSTITHVLNYPNPFSTATAFVFTLTGSEIPSQFKIQIMTVTGKVVREITKAELGPIRIGRNITEYKWDGRDQYGQLLGNGVYFYRVVTSIKGQSIEHRSDMDLKQNGNNVDRFFKNGYGKMYIMR